VFLINQSTIDMMHRRILENVNKHLRRARAAGRIAKIQQHSLCSRFRDAIPHVGCNRIDVITDTAGNLEVENILVQPKLNLIGYTSPAFWELALLSAKHPGESSTQPH